MARVYDDAVPEDGTRVLVDRLWPRGFRKDDARVGTWLKGVAPSTELRRWYSHEMARYDDFVARYTAELAAPEAAAALDELRALADQGVVTLVTSARDLEDSHVGVLAGLLQE
jgi:uncharacterized protein YeaO (DUF488 family)